MDLETGTALLGGMSAAGFMGRVWQRKPMLVRAAWPGVKPPLTRAALFALAGRDDVESRLISHQSDGWTLRQGPLSRRSLPPLSRPRWTLLVQGVDLHDDAAHAMLAPFRFVGDARLDDLMVSFATDGGGVGPHLDAYDVFLLQMQGRRRWRVGPVRDRRLVDGAPLKLLRHFEATQDWLLEPGDMLYLPPMWGHDGVAVGECMTASIGFRAPARAALARDLMHLVAESLPESTSADVVYRDAAGAATATPARIASGLQAFAQDAWQRVQGDATLMRRALGQWLSEPKAQVWFTGGLPLGGADRALRLDRRSRMIYDDDHIFLNGEWFRIRGRDVRILRKLADQRQLSGADRKRLGAPARALLVQWSLAGWLHEC